MTAKSPRKKVGKNASAKNAVVRKKASKPAVKKETVGRESSVYVVRCEWMGTDYGSGRDDGRSILGIYSSRELANEAVLSYFSQWGTDCFTKESRKSFTKAELKKPFRELTKEFENGGEVVRVWAARGTRKQFLKHQVQDEVGDLDTVGV